VGVIWALKAWIGLFLLSFLIAFVANPFYENGTLFISLIPLFDFYENIVYRGEFDCNNSLLICLS
jgi:hypothetical protein